MIFDLKRRRLELGLTLEQVGDYVGVGKSTVRRWETGDIQNMRRDKIQALSEILKIDPTIIVGIIAEEPESDLDIFSIPGILPMPKMKKVPRLGAIACGKPALAIEEADEFDEAPADLDCDFSLVCKGDSMINARIYDGDIVYVRSQSDVDSGQIAVVLIDDEALLKRVHKHPGEIVLAPENPAYRSIIITGPQQGEVRILGLAVWFRSRVR